MQHLRISSARMPCLESPCAPGEVRRLCPEGPGHKAKAADSCRLLPSASWSWQCLNLRAPRTTPLQRRRLQCSASASAAAVSQRRSCGQRDSSRLAPGHPHGTPQWPPPFVSTRKGPRPRLLQCRDEAPGPGILESLRSARAGRLLGKTADFSLPSPSVPGQGTR